MLSFLQQLWPPALFASLGGVVVVAKLRKGKDGSFVAVAHAASLEEATAVTEREADSGNIYYGVALRRPGLHPQATGRKDDLVAFPGVWLDVDIRDGRAHKAEDLPPTLDDVEEVLIRALPPASLTVHTGHGLHIYHLFREPLVCKWQEFEGYLKKHQARLAKAFKGKGWSLDPMAVTTVLRLPNTWNHKTTERLPVQWLDDDVDNRPRYTVHDLSLVPAPRSPAAASVAVSDGLDPHSTVERPNVDGGTAPALAPGSRRGRPATRWKSYVREYLEKVTTNNREGILQILAGQPFAKEGKRNNKCQVLASAVAMQALNALDWGTIHEVTGQELYDEFFVSSIAAMAAIDDDPTNPALTEHEVVRMLQASLDDAIAKEPEKRRQREAQQKRTRAFALEQARKKAEHRGKRQEPAALLSSDPTTLFPAGSTSPVSAPPTPPPAPPPAPPSVSPALLDEHLLIIQYRNSFYFLDTDGAYGKPKTKDEMTVALRDAAEDDAIELFKTVYLENGDEKEKRKTQAEVLSQYASLAEKVYFDLTINDSWYDPGTKFFYEAAAKQRNITPEYHPEIDTWLRLLGGIHQEKLLDWIATVTWQHLQSSCLYISDAPDAGKTLLAHGLAALWGSPPIDLEHVASTSSFNASLLDCPLVFADERMPKGVGLAEMRKLVARDNCLVTRKHLPEASLKGALRFMIVANNRNLLAGDESDTATEYDLAATAQRFFHIAAGPAAAEFLQSLGGRSGGTKDWINQDLIAKHALWLRDNRKIVPGKRFVVEGEMSDVHQKLLTRGAITSKVFEFLARYVTDPGRALGAKHDGFLVGEQKVLVRAEAMAESWSTMFANTRPVTGAQVSDALRNLSVGRLRPHSSRTEERPRYWSVNTQWLLDWAAEYKIGDVEEIQKRIDGPLQVQKPSVLTAMPGGKGRPVGA